MLKTVRNSMLKTSKTLLKTCMFLTCSPWLNMANVAPKNDNFSFVKQFFFKNSPRKVYFTSKKENKNISNVKVASLCSKKPEIVAIDVFLESIFVHFGTIWKSKI